ncbi:hypothetical protein [Halogeometricum limi]|uniref:Uncharacterized protein n=1 Tax=Halogeometricum limi TaxID=555875 RepID=A0A1I6FQZ3_9EURY|nr:hypothetical protein [Halogeometricum limi]SFR32308.1 hypothetical protein SAMN04488124_0098 [Halogeometricum limi]
MSTNFSEGVVRTFYGEPQHETEVCVDAERVRVAPTPPTCERALHGDAYYEDAEWMRAYAEVAAQTA